MTQTIPNTKKVWMIGGALLGMVLFLGLFSIMLGDTPVAILNIEGGIVEYYNGAEWIAAIDGMELGPKDTVRTQQGRATLFIYDSIIINLEPDTEVNIKELSGDHVKIEQRSGSTWNKFLNLAGLVNYEIETPTTRATVRGTEFGIIIEDAGDSVIVAEGKVEFAATGRDGNRYTAEAGDVLTRIKDTVKIQRTDMTFEKKTWLAKNVVRTISDMRELRARTISAEPQLRSSIEPGPQTDNKLDAVMMMDAEQRTHIMQSEESDLRSIISMSDGSLDKINSHIKKQLTLIDKLATDESMNSAMRIVLKTDDARKILEPLINARSQDQAGVSAMSAIRDMMRSIDTEEVLTVAIGEVKDDGASLTVTDEGTLVAAYDPPKDNKRTAIRDEPEPTITLMTEQEPVDTRSTIESTRITLHDDPTRISLVNDE